MDDAGFGIEPPDYRLPRPSRVRLVRLQVADLDRSLAYYTDVLGLTEIGRAGGQVALGGADGATLVELREQPGAAPVPRRGRLGLFHFAVLLPDRPALGAFVRHLSWLGEPTGASDHLVSEALYLTDPDGLGIEVYADRPREEWRHRDRQLVMATDPLDVTSVVRSAEGREWMGVPAGAAIGHVHLHVGDLREAERFYHESLGLDKVVWSYPGALFLSAGGYHHHLGVNTWARAALPAAETDARLLEWELVVPAPADVREVGESLERSGYAVEREGTAVLTRDPWGTALRIRATGVG